MTGLTRDQASEQEQPLLARLLDEVVLRAFAFLSPTEVIRVRRVCRRLAGLGHDPALWHSLVLAKKGTGGFNISGLALRSLIANTARIAVERDGRGITCVDVDSTRLFDPEDPMPWFFEALLRHHGTFLEHIHLLHGPLDPSLLVAPFKASSGLPKLRTLQVTVSLSNAESFADLNRVLKLALHKSPCLEALALRTRFGTGLPAHQDLPCLFADCYSCPSMRRLDIDGYLLGNPHDGTPYSRVVEDGYGHMKASVLARIFPGLRILNVSFPWRFRDQEPWRFTRDPELSAGTWSMQLPLESIGFGITYLPRLVTLSLWLDRPRRIPLVLVHASQPGVLPYLSHLEIRSLSSRRNDPGNQSLAAALDQFWQIRRKTQRWKLVRTYDPRSFERAVIVTLSEEEIYISVGPGTLTPLGKAAIEERE
ncbi:hypothetical protein DFJ74DRAFT_76807 [Hyaloraphidium curvatum]|nr:hypothetical protein DFJ74DRAFT_76807 [Hyaloraphidium curvatum]